MENSTTALSLAFILLGFVIVSALHPTIQNVLGTQESENTSPAEQPGKVSHNAEVSRNVEGVDEFTQWLSQQPGVVVYEDTKLYQCAQSDYSPMASFVMDVDGVPETIVVAYACIVSPPFSLAPTRGTIYYASQPITVPDIYSGMMKPHTELYGFCFATLT